MSQATMRALRLYGPGQRLPLEEVPLPLPAPGEALVRVRAAGICHTELHMLDGVLNLGVVPLTPGHEVVGEVVEARDPTFVRPGQRVLLYYYAPCHDCDYCRSGAENLCPNVARQFGFSADGGYAEYLVAPATSLVPLPDSLTDAEAVGLACGGATALHATRTVAEVRLGETVVVYGVGGVGFYLVQLCRMAGARVVVVGRTAEKLRLAAALGAHACINAREDDPLTAVHEVTGGRGAAVVFDLVANAETMELAPRMLARRGRLVFAGYGADRLQLSPLWLVLREVQLRGAVGNTLAELRETVELAASGALRSVVGRSFPLEAANEALADLRAGRLIGRAVLVPGMDGVEGATEDGVAHGVEAGLKPAPTEAQAVSPQQAEGRPPLKERGKHPRFARVPAKPAEGGCPPGGNSRAAPFQRALSNESAPLGAGVGGAMMPPTIPLLVRRPPAVPSGSALERALLDFIAQGVDGPLAADDAAFNALALDLFAYQYEASEPYRQFCDYRGTTPGRAEHWTELPAVPIAAFKEATLATEPIERAVAVFMSSGTTRADRRSRHFHPSLAVYNASARTNFAAHLLPDGATLPALVLNPPPAALPNSSLAHYLGLMVDAYGAEGSDYFVDDGGLRRERLLAVLRDAADARRPVCLLGTTFAFVHLLDWLAAEDVRLALPDGSRVMDTGGVKGKSREIGRGELEVGLIERLGVAPAYQVNMYGLTELSTQFLDATLRQVLGNQPVRRYKTVPAWARTRVLDPDSLVELPPGEVGVLCHTDLANRASVCAILTEDLGVARDGGFEILGRVAGAQARGCSIAMDELLTATGQRA